jgi:hypothetical protein
LFSFSHGVALGYGIAGLQPTRKKEIEQPMGGEERKIEYS